MQQAEGGLEVQDGIRAERAAEAITLVVAGVRAQQSKLQAIMEESRAEAAVHLTGQRRVREESAGVASRIAKLEAEIAQRRSSELALEIIALREQHHTLRQQETRLAERIEGLTAFTQRLLLAILESETVAATLTAEGPLEGNRGLLGSTSWRVVQAQEEERERLAREIHDGPAQALANAIFELEFCERLLEKDPVKLRKELVRLNADVRQALADVRHFIFGLRPAVLAELGLATTLRRYAEDYQARCGIAVTLEIEEPLRLSGTQDVAIFRIVQEALQNTRKHSKAARVLVRLRAEPGKLVITIEDDGEGFDLAQAGERSIGHFGLRGMQERARLIGAELEITSQPEKGTRVVLVVPQEAQDERG